MTAVIIVAIICITIVCLVNMSMRVKYIALAEMFKEWTSMQKKKEETEKHEE